jgi:hopanoid biosynthesis associated RND transporter like protein HpnN
LVIERKDKTSSAMSLNARPLYRLCAAVAQRWPWPTLAVSLVLTALAAYASTFLTIDTSTEDIIAEHVEFRQTANAYNRIFPMRGEPIIALIEHPTGHYARELASGLARRLQDRSEVVRRVELPGAEPYFQKNALMLLETDQLRELTQRLESSGPLLAGLLADPSLRGLASLVGQLNQAADAGRPLPPEAASIVEAMAGTTAAQAEGRKQVLPWRTALGLELRHRETDGVLLVYPHLDDASLDPAQPALNAVRSSFEEVAQGSGASLRMTGMPALREQELESAFSGALYASILSFVLVALTLVIGIRSWRVIFALLVTLVIGSVWTSGLAALAVRELNLISLAFMVLFFGLGVDFGTHLALRQMESVAGGADTTRATRRAVRGEGPAIVLSTVCASIGFLSFLPTDYRGLAELGIISALGMLVAAIITLVLLPAIMTLLPPKVAETNGTAARWFSEFVERRAVPILAAAAAITVAAGVLATQARIDVNPLNLQDPDAPAVRAFRDLAERPQLSPFALNIAAPSLEAARELVPQLERVQGVADVRTIEDLIPNDQEEKRGLLAGIARTFGDATARSREDLDAAALQNAFTQLRESTSQIAHDPAQRVAVGPFQKLSTALGEFEARRGTGEASLERLTLR